MRVRHRLVNMFMFVPLGEMQPDAQSHHAAGQQQLNGDGLSQAHNGNDGAEEWGRRKICAGAQMPEHDDEKRGTNASWPNEIAGLGPQG